MHTEPADVRIEAETGHRSPSRTGPGGPASLDSHALLGTAGEVLIAHCGETYRLRRTRQNKLILTK
ncbi:hemin uptake protein HemP [Tistrella mobilis]|jgi:hemin uptake protein HemP|uniref:hemin uptake protein HemP n=1 Tax=Tistrella mobilis TaxID=171437 RepID=UPI003558E3BC